MSKNSRGFVAMAAIAVIVLLALVGVGSYVYYTKQNQPAAQQAKDTTPAQYQSNADLDNASTALDNTDINAGLDTSLQQLDSDAANF